jgi:hypothetical protein
MSKFIYSSTWLAGNVLRLRAVGDLEPICCHRKQMQFKKTIDKLTTKTPIDFSRCYAFVAFPNDRQRKKYLIKLSVQENILNVE